MSGNKMVKNYADAIMIHDGNPDNDPDDRPVVVVPNAVVEPRTVVVHFEDAGVADAAVVCPGRLWLDALLADGGHLQQDYHGYHDYHPAAGLS
jgi:hypothetical protein